ncbi:MAG: cupin domain-containing protein [Planctomycetota bacterium]|nr:cupin domain-containing protein [Planctomycetota bacterium]
MRIKRLRSHPRFRLEGASDHFQSCWELELNPGEETSPHRHYEREELLYLVSGRALVTIESIQREVTTGEVVLIPPRHSHKIINRSNRPLHALSVESRFDTTEISYEEQKSTAPSESLATALSELAPVLNESEAIQKLVEIFNVGSQLSVHLEASRDITAQAGQEAMERLERDVMNAVLEITKRYHDEN